MAVVQLDLSINNHRSLSTYKPWKTLIRSCSLNYQRLATHETPRFTSGTQQSNMLMDTNNLTPPRRRAHAPDESSPLLQNESGNRSYQAYCVTETSSRPQSPDTLTPRPLCIRSSFAQDQIVESRIVVDRSLAQLPATSIEQDPTLAISSEQVNGSNAQQVLPSRILSSQNTMFADDHHITQAVTPRGSHPLAAEQTLVCDGALSHSRMQQRLPAYVVTSRAYQRKPVPQPSRETIMEPRPLPPLPIEVGTNPDLENLTGQSQHMQTMEEDMEQALQQVKIQPRNRLEDQTTGRRSTAGVDKENLRILPQVNTYLERPLKFSKPRVLFQAEICCPSSHGPRNDAAIRESNNPQEGKPYDKNAQIPSSQEMYIPRGLFSEMNDNRRAHRRTEPKDPKFKYQFGHRPSVRLEKPPATPHRLIPRPSHPALSYNTPSEHARNTHRTSSSPLTSFPPFNDSHPGPRPPPWGSYDNLELQRRDRADAREREEARKFRFHADSASSVSKGSSDSSPSLCGNTMRREVEEYREQVLRVYPDMGFDGSAGKGGRSCVWCVVM
jgi:hypothetical protein